ncbi:MAG: hypothetical protein Q9167_005051 [Letrouitia subvulpina]
MSVARLSPVKISLRQPVYVPSSSPSEGSESQSSTQNQPQPQNHRPQHFRTQNPGWGSRHIHDNAPFSLWDHNNTTFRNPSNHEIDWIFDTYQPKAVHIGPPDIFVDTEHPPTKIPLTLGGALVRFAPPGLCIPMTPFGSLRPYPDRKRDDLLTSPLPLYSIPPHEICLEIMQLLGQEVDFRAIHFLPPLIYVELDISTGKAYNRHSLPSKAGDVSIQYCHSAEGYWKGLPQMDYQRLTTPVNTVVDNSDYISQDPHQISPGVCLASSSPRQETSAGLCLQKGNKKYITVANHAFPQSDEVYHPSPTGYRVGQITDRFTVQDIVFAELDPSISFSNKQYFAAPTPSRLISTEEIKAGDWFEVDGYSAGRFDVCARG